jgi:hypothetical protein
MESEPGHDETAAVSGEANVDDVKRKFREALDLKQGKRSRGAVADEGRNVPGCATLMGWPTPSVSSVARTVDDDRRQPAQRGPSAK